MAQARATFSSKFRSTSKLSLCKRSEEWIVLAARTIRQRSAPFSAGPDHQSWQYAATGVRQFLCGGDDTTTLYVGNPAHRRISRKGKPDISDITLT